MVLAVGGRVAGAGVVVAAAAVAAGNVHCRAGAVALVVVVLDAVPGRQGVAVVVVLADDAVVLLQVDLILPQFWVKCMYNNKSIIQSLRLSIN